MQRRDFLKASASALVLAPFVIAGVGAGGSDPYSRAFFTSRIGTWFDAGDARSLQLLSVDAGPASAQLDQFTLSFRGDPREALGDGAVALHAESGEQLELFLQRRTDASDGSRFAASFSLVRPLSAASCARA